MLLNFRQLEVFRAIMISKTISGAAELLHVSQPGISRLLKYMEYKLGIALFERHKGRLIPTPEGEELFRELELIYERIEDLDITINRITQQDDLQFRVACTPSLAAYLMPRLLAKVRDKMPGVSFQLETLPNEAIAEYIIQRRCDFALAFYDPDHPLILSEPSISVGMQCVVPVDHPLANKDQVTFEEIAQYDLVMFYSDTLLGTRMNQALEKLDVKPKVSVVIRYANDACAMVQQGMGVTVVFEHTVGADRFPKLRAIPINGNSQRLHFLRHNGISMSNNVRKLYELAKTEIRALD